MVVNPELKVADDKLVQPLKPFVPIDVTEFGIEMVVKLVHPLNAVEFIFVTLLPLSNVTDARFVLLEKQPTSMLIAEVPIVTPTKVFPES